MVTKARLLSFVGALTLFVLPVSATAQTQLGLTCPTVPLIASRLSSAHLLPPKDDAEFAKRVAKIYADRVDPNEILLKEDEYQALQRRVRFSLAKVSAGDCTELDQLKVDMVAWQKDMEDFVRASLKKSLKINKKRKLVLDPKKRPRPKTDKEQAKLRRALIEFQLANYLANGTKRKEAGKKLVHRYELGSKRFREQTESDIFSMYLNAYASALDPHTTYFSAEDLEDFRISMQLSLQGIGARLLGKDGLTTIEELVPGGAADKQGKLKPKDQIVAVAQGIGGEPVDVIDMDLRDVVKLIRGKKGTKVTLTVMRKGKKLERFNVTIERDKIDLKEQAASLKWRKVKRGKKTLKIAVLDLPSFYQGDSKGAGRSGSSDDVARLLKQAKREGAEGIMLDLSRNGGGLLDAAVDISGYFIESGGVVGVGAPNSRPQILEDRDISVLWDGPLVVHTSKLSASASEILAGALQDYGRAVIVGDTSTFGKGTVQQMSPLPPGLGALKVTTSMFFLPGGKSTQNIGVSSDVVVPSPFSKFDIGESFENYALGPVTTRSFVSPKANVNKRWTPVSKDTLKALAKKSAKRLKSDKAFKALKKELAKADTKYIKLADILKSGGDDADEKKKKKDEDELSIQSKEAVQVLVDLILAK